MNGLNLLSLTTVPIDILSSTGLELGKATGFFLREPEGQLVLITNWHVVTGRKPTQPKLSENGAVPCTLRCKLHKKVDEAGIRLSQIMQVDQTINDDDGDNPRWLEHPTHRHSVDVVAIPISEEGEFADSCMFRELNSYRQFLDEYVPTAMDTVFVIGYPWGLTGGSMALPLYKRGSIASEPIVDFGGKPRMLVDCRTTEAMSGSPVIVSHSGIWNPGGGVMGPDSCIGTMEKFLGVYSGRLYDSDIPDHLKGDDKKVSDIGVVWKESVVREVALKGVPGTTITEIGAM